MKNLKNNRWLAGIAMVLFVFGIFFIVKAVEKNTNLREGQMEEVNETTWHFTGTQTSEILEAGKWALGSSPNTSCVLDDQEPLPCQFTVSDANITNTMELIAYFNARYPIDTSTKVKDNADSQKPEE